MFVFWKIYALFSCNTCFEIRSFALLLTIRRCFKGKILQKHENEGRIDFIMIFPILEICRLNKICFSHIVTNAKLHPATIKLLRE